MIDKKVSFFDGLLELFYFGSGKASGKCFNYNANSEHY